MTERKEKFTPGPWERAKNKSRGGSGKVRGLSISRVVDSNGAVIAFTCPRRRQVANLHLIASAPEMYDLLDHIEDVMDDSSGCGEIPIEKIREVLKKARGDE